MISSVTKGSSPNNTVLALNVPALRYQQHFVAEAPENLGIILVALISDRATKRQEESLSYRMLSVGMTMRAMFEYDEFFAEFAPPNMINYTIAASAFRVSDGLLGVPPTADVRQMHLATSFFNPKQVRIPTESELYGCAIASLVLGRMAMAVDSYDPADLQPLALSFTAAADYRKRVGNLYESGCGIWCEDLVEFSGLMKVATHALLGELPLVNALRSVMASGNDLPGRIEP